MSLKNVWGRHGSRCPQKHRAFSSTEDSVSDNERAFNTVRAHLFKWPDPFTPSWIGSIMSQGASDAGRNGTAHCTMRNLTRACVWEEADCGRALTGGENARAQGLFSRVSLTRNVTLLNLELGLFFFSPQRRVDFPLFGHFHGEVSHIKVKTKVVAWNWWSCRSRWMGQRDNQKSCWTCAAYQMQLSSNEKSDR